MIVNEKHAAMLIAVKDWCTVTATWPNNQWHTSPLMEVYMRRYDDVRLSGQRVVDIANVTVHPKHQGQGVYTEFLEMLLGMTSTGQIHRLRVENVLEKRFQEFHRGKGMLELDEGMGEQGVFSYIVTGLRGRLG